MLLNYGAPRLAPNIVAAPKDNIDINAILGLRSSPYKGLKQLGKQDLYYGKGGLYEPYTITSSPRSYYPTYGMGGYMNFGGTNEVAGTIKIGDQAFKPYTGDAPKGFSKFGDTYNPSMAYVYANTPQPKVLPTPNVTSFLSTPTAMSTPTGNYGAGRFLSEGLLGMPINFSIASAGENS